MLTVAAGVIACASARTSAEVPDAADTLLSSDVIARWDADTQRSAPSAHRLAAREKTRVIRAPDSPKPRPLGTRRRVDVRFRKADLDNALRFLADAGGFALVTGEGLTGRVDLDLRRVRPYEALVAVARAHGAVVHNDGKVVLVTRE